MLGSLKIWGKYRGPDEVTGVSIGLQIRIEGECYGASFALELGNIQFDWTNPSLAGRMHWSISPLFRRGEVDDQRAYPVRHGNGGRPHAGEVRARSGRPVPSAQGRPGGAWSLVALWGKGRLEERAVGSSLRGISKTRAKGTLRKGAGESSPTPKRTQL